MLPLPVQSMMKNTPTLCMVMPLTVVLVSFFIMIPCAPFPLNCNGCQFASARGIA